MLKPETALSLFPPQKCTLGCPVLDRFLHGGIPCNSITELVSESGCGKTQFCLQLLLCAQLPFSHGGLNSSSFYIHTEFPFPSRRLQQLSRLFFLRFPSSPLQNDTTNPRTVNPNPCDNIFVHGVHTADDLLTLLDRMELLFTRPLSLPVKLVVIDSVAALFRSEFDNTPADLRRRSTLFFEIAGRLKSQATRFGLAVVVVNQVVDLMDSDVGLNGVQIGNFGFLISSGRRVCPALGLSWANCVNSRLFLSRSDEIRNAEGGSDGVCSGFRSRRKIQVVFAPHLPESSCEFVIEREGLFGVANS